MLLLISFNYPPYLLHTESKEGGGVCFFKSVSMFTASQCQLVCIAGRLPLLFADVCFVHEAPFGSPVLRCAYLSCSCIVCAIHIYVKIRII